MLHECCRMYFACDYSRLVLVFDISDLCAASSARRILATLGGGCIHPTRFAVTPTPALRLLHLCICACFALMGTWLRFSAYPPLLPPAYNVRFVLFAALLLTFALWLASSAPGFVTLRRVRGRALPLLCLLLLALWAYASQSWGFAVFQAPEAGWSAALGWGAVALFCIVVAAAAPPPAWVARALITAALLNGVLAIAQADAGGALGIRELGEFRFGTGIDGTSLIRAGALTFVRPYGLLAHPNMLGGTLALGAILGAAAFLRGRGWVRSAGWLVVTCVLAWALGLTFSRAAWLGLAAGGLSWLGAVWRSPSPKPGRAAVFAIAAIFVGALFVTQYRPLLGARVGEGTESLELRSVSDRLVYTDFALRAIAERPLLGQGAGYFPWRASAYLAQTFFDLRGDHVHQVYLSAWAELGVVGLALLVAALCLGVEAALRALRQPSPDSAWRAGLLACALALAVIGLFDHYPYSQLPFMALWWGLLAAAGSAHEYGAAAS